MIDHNKLIEDLKIGKQLAEVAAQGDDGGTCNLDAVYIKLDRTPEKVAQDWFKQAGLHTYKTTVYGAKVFFIGGFSSGQADSNYRAVEALYKYLRECGWDVGVWYQMD